MRLPPALTWLLKCALAALTVLLVWRLATVAIGYGLQQPAVTTRDGTLITLNRYVRELTPDLVLVGSSVTWRLKEELFSRGSVRNLALAGGSPVTGLAVVANQPRLPKVVLIETNILSRPIDSAIVAQFAAHGRSAPLFLRPLRIAVAAYENWNHAPPGAAELRATQAQLLSRPPNDFDNRAYVARAVREMNEGDAAGSARTNIALIRQLIEGMAARGTRAFLIEIPFSPEIEDTRLVRTTKQVAREAFPNRAQWLPIDPPLQELRWADGVHLDERSALLVARSIEQALAAR